MEPPPPLPISRLVNGRRSPTGRCGDFGERRCSSPTPFLIGVKKGGRNAFFLMPAEATAGVAGPDRPEDAAQLASINSAQTGARVRIVTEASGLPSVEGGRDQYKKCLPCGRTGETAITNPRSGIARRPKRITSQRSPPVAGTSKAFTVEPAWRINGIFPVGEEGFSPTKNTPSLVLSASGRRARHDATTEPTQA